MIYLPTGTTKRSSGATLREDRCRTATAVVCANLEAGRKVNKIVAPGRRWAP